MIELFNSAYEKYNNMVGGLEIMNKILLIDIDSTIPNLALHKIAKFYQDMDYEVVWNMPLFASDAEKIFVSCIFPENKEKCDRWEGIADIGGTGYDIKKCLPPEIDAIKPKINWGFTTRGCIRKCKWCFVPNKEGGIRIEGDIYDIWDGKSKELIIMDNNILALPDHFFKIAEQLKANKLKVDFNQGLDHRLLTPEICKELISLKHIHEIRFAFDHIKYKPTVEKALKMLQVAGLKDWQSRWYVYVSPTDTFDNVFERMEFLRQNKQAVYVMRDRKITTIGQFVALASWGNTMGAFKMPLKDVLIKSKRMSHYGKYFIDREKLLEE